MSKFVYRMQSILDLKIKLEEQAKMEFAAARIRLDQEQERLETLLRRRQEYEEEGRRLRGDSLNVLEIKENREAVKVLEEFEDRQRIQIQIAENELEEKRMALQEVVQERKVQEKLKEKAFETFVMEENAREGKEVDELVSYRYGQKRR